MLDLDTALELLKKYGYTSTSVHPYIYKNNDTIGVCYSLIDEKYGFLERVALFRTKEEMDDFLKKYQWFKQNGKANDVDMLFDRYDTPSPNILYYRKGKLMAADEMFNISKYDEEEVVKEEKEVVSTYIDVATNLIKYYDEIKNTEINFLKSLKELLQERRKKYYDLQLLIDKYNDRVKIRKILDEDNISLEAGINIDMERALKEKLSQYRSEVPKKEEAITFIKEVFDLCMNLELNTNYLNGFVIEHNTKNDIVLATWKIDYMNKIIKNKDNPFLIKDLTKEFAKIDKEVMSKQASVVPNFIENCSNAIRKKYSYYNILEPLKVAAYLEEVKTNKNYEAVATKYKKVVEKVEEKIELYDYEDIVKDLDNQFKVLPVQDQNELIFYFSYQELFNLIINIPNYETLDVTTIISNLEKIDKWEDIKEKDYNNVKMALTISKNDVYKKSVFSTIDYTTLESFITSLLKILTNIKQNKKLILKANTEVYFVTDKYDILEQLSIIDTTLDIGYINGQVTANRNKKAILANLNKGVSVIYSDRIVEFAKDKELEFTTKLRENKNITFNLRSTNFQKEKDLIVVTKYSANIVKEKDISIVDKLNINARNEYYKVIFTNKG